ncbi:MAG: 6-bladed beta-propeller [Bacteroidales bacterium]
MYNKTLLIYLLVIILLPSCSTEKAVKDNHATINIADNIGKGFKLNLSEIAESVEYIPLETNDYSVIGKVDDVGFSNECIVINTKLNSKNIFKIFAKDGSYKNGLDHEGRGPNEYYKVITSDLYNDHIVILTYNKIVEYSFDDKFIRSIPLSTEVAPIGYYAVKKLNDSQYLLTINNSFKLKNPYSAIIVDTCSKIKLKFPYPQSEFEISENIPRENKPLRATIIFKNKNTGRIITGYNEYIISHDNDFRKIDTLFKIKYGEYQVTKNNIAERNKKSKLINIYSPVLESDNYIYLELNLYCPAHKPMKMKTIVGGVSILPSSCSIYDKRNGSFRLIDQPEDYQKGFIDDFEGGPAFWPLYISQDDYMVSIIEAYKFIQYAQTHKVSDKFKKIADNLKEDDNPVVVLVKLKK